MGRPLDPPLLVVLDEAASVAPLADLDRVVATAAGHGVQLVTVWQDLAQVESRYGGRWATVVNNHRAKLICSGIADPVTLQHVSGLLGDEERAERSWTVGDDGRHSRTEAVDGAGARASGLAPPAASRRGRTRLRELASGADRAAALVRRPRSGRPSCGWLSWVIPGCLPLRRGRAGGISGDPGPSRIGRRRRGTRPREVDGVVAQPFVETSDQR